MLTTSTFLALDLGGTNLRVCEVVLAGNHQFEIKQQKYKVSDELKNGEARVLFGECCGVGWCGVGECGVDGSWRCGAGGEWLLGEWLLS
jgi:hypothetical protein